MEKLKEVLRNRTFWLWALIILFVIIFIIYIKKRNREKKQTEEKYLVRKEAVKDKVTEKEKQLSNYLRKLFAEHALWTKNYMNSFLTNAPNIDDTAKRVQKNQEQIGRALGMWYGTDAGKKIGQLFLKHISYFELMLKEMLEKNKNGSIIAEKRWHDATNQLVDYITSINPKINVTALSQNFKTYNENITSAATAKYRKKHSEEITSFDKINNQAEVIADMLTEGIVKHFPSQFDKEAEPDTTEETIKKVLNTKEEK